MEKITSFRLKQEELVFLDKFAKEEHESKGQILRELLVNGRIMTAIIMYKKNKISIGRASEMAGVNISEFMNILSEFGISSNVTLEDYKESLENLKNILSKK